MIVAVTGSSGFIGSRLIKVLKDAGHAIIELDLKNGVNILDWEQLKKIDQFDVVVHLAGMSFVPHSYEQPRDFLTTNINGVINMLELCRINNAKMVFASSYVYGTPENLPISEKHILTGFNPYADSKIIGEKICRSYFDHFGINSIILRPFNIYGPGQNTNFLIPLILHQASSGKIEIKDHRPKRDFVFVDDVVTAFLKAVENKSIQFDQFNIGTGFSYSVRQIVDMVCSLSEQAIEVSYLNIHRNNEVLDTVADISKAKDKLNWVPTIEVLEGLKYLIKL